VAARLPAAARRRQLLEVAERTFAGRGFHDASMNDIAEAAGVTKPVLYQHFRSKRGLYLAALHDVGDRLRLTIDKATADAGSPREQVLAGIVAYFRFVADHDGAFDLLFGGGNRNDPEFDEAARAVEATLARLVAERIDVEDLEPARRELFGHAVVGLVEGAGRHWLTTGRPVPPEAAAAAVAGLVWAGLRGIGSGA